MTGRNASVCLSCNASLLLFSWPFTSTETIWFIRNGQKNGMWNEEPRPTSLFTHSYWLLKCKPPKSRTLEKTFCVCTQWKEQTCYHVWFIYMCIQSRSALPPSPTLKVPLSSECWSWILYRRKTSETSFCMCSDGKKHYCYFCYCFDITYWYMLLSC